MSNRFGATILERVNHKLSDRRGANKTRIGLTTWASYLDRAQKALATLKGWDSLTPNTPSPKPPAEPVITPKSIYPVSCSNVVYDGFLIQIDYGNYKISFHIQKRTLSKTIKDGNNFYTQLPSPVDIIKFRDDVKKAANNNELISQAIKDIEFFA